MTKDIVYESYQLPETPEEAQALVNPHLGTSFFRLGNAFVLVHEGMRLSQQSKENIFGDRTNDSKFTFDYFDLATNEVDLSSDALVLPSFQHLMLLIKIKSVFTGDDPLEKDFLDVVKQSPDKPFLIINGHGGQRFENSVAELLGKTSWLIGEKSGRMSIDLQDLFKKIDPQKYSAILLVSCNEEGILPPHIPGTPVYFVKGISGFDFADRRVSLKR